MPRTGHYSISQRLTWVNMLVSGGALLLACSVLFAYDFYTFRASILSNMSTDGEIIGSNTASALLFNDPIAAEGTLLALTASPHIVRAEIYTPDRRLFAHYQRDRNAQPSALPAIPRGGKEIHSFDQAGIAVIRPIIFQQKLIGYVYVQSDLQATNDRLRSYALIVAAVLLVSLIAALLISKMSQRVICAPMEELAETARAVSREKDYSIRFPTGSHPDELAVLVDAFNEMLAEIQRRDSAALEAHGELEKRVQERTTQLAAANRAKSVFLSTMSHEIRTPMNAILGYAQLMLRDPSRGAEDKANLQIIGRSGAHLLGLINDVLDLSQIEAGRTEVRPTRFDLEKLLEDLAAMFRLRAEAKALSFEVLVEAATADVVADEGKLRQVMINLVGNAIKFTQRGKVKLHVTLDTRAENELWLAASIEDTGPGMTTEELEKLFQPFSQTERGLNTAESSGLGLSISRQYARLMGGDISVASVPGQGSAFRLEIPLERAAAGIDQRVAAPRIRRVRAGGEAPRILVVDDQFENRDWLIKLLTAVGFSVSYAEDGETAIRIWEESKPQLILMDVHMGAMDGLEATRRIKASPLGDETPIIILSASALDEDRRKIEISGADDFLMKPCMEEPLFEKIGALLNISYEYEQTGKRFTGRRRQQRPAERRRPE